MGKVCAGATMSHDGYIAGPEEMELEPPYLVVEGIGVTHLRYRISERRPQVGGPRTD